MTAKPFALDTLIVVVGTLSSLRYGRRYAAQQKRGEREDVVPKKTAVMFSMGIWLDVLVLMTLIESFSNLWWEIFILWFVVTLTALLVIKQKRSRHYAFKQQ